MKIIKYETKNLRCKPAKAENGTLYYEIWEKGNDKKPIALYVDKDTLHLANEFPENEAEYKHIEEFCEIIKMLVESC